MWRLSAASWIIPRFHILRRSADVPLRLSGSFQLHKGEMREKLESDLEV